MVVAADRCPVGEGDDSDRENPQAVFPICAVDDLRDANVVVGAGTTAKEDGNISDGPVVDALAVIR